MHRLVWIALGLAACGPSPMPSSGPDTPPPADDPPPLVDTWWRLQSLGGSAPVEGNHPVLIFTDTPAERDTYDRPYPARFADWRIVTGDLGIGHLHAPYRIRGDSVRFAEPYDRTRLSTPAETDQAQRLARALDRARTFAQAEDRLLLLGPGRDTLAVFRADPPRPPGPLDGIEWVLETIDGQPTPDGTRADLVFTAQRLGPGPGDGFDSFGGYSGCNWYGGGYRLDAEAPARFRLTTNGEIVSTARGCAPEASAVEDAVQRSLAESAAIQVSRAGVPGERLVVLDSTGSERLVFRRHVPRPVDLDALRRGRWRFQSTDNEYARPSPGTDLAFSDSTFEARTGCFRSTGVYQIDGDNLSVPMSEGDASACGTDERSQLRVFSLSQGKLSVTDDRLDLYDENGGRTVFERP